MCGIAGLISLSDHALPADAEARVQRMTARLRHRGPDDTGVFVDSGRRAVLGHARLAIIDPTEEAHQPMRSERGNAITFNGEIYNFRELATKHAVGPSASDTAILLQLLERRGTPILPEIVGFFSFAYWDANRGTVTIARDRFGKKPIYYYEGDGQLVFASELGALCASGLIPGTISREALGEYLRYYTMPHPLTPIEGVRCLPPASILTIGLTSGATRTEQWWSLRQPGTADVSYDEAVRGVRERLERSVHYRMVSDVPVGAFLSGGLDSNVIVALMSRQEQGLKTFTIGFSGFTQNETALARIGARHFTTDHHEHTYTDTEVAGLLPEFFAAMDSPTGDGLNSFLVSRFARQVDRSLKVIVTGTGGDESFLGYKKYRWIAQHPAIAKIVRGAPAKNALLCALAGVNHPAASLARALIAPGSIRQLFGQAEIRELLGVTPGTGGLEGAQLEDLLRNDFAHYLPDMLLRDMDVFTMAHSFEARVPLLDAELVVYVWQLPLKYKRRGLTKQLLIDATKDILPPDLLAQPKTGFELPLAEWMKRGALRPWLERLTTGDLALVRDGLLKPDSVRSVYSDFTNGRSHYLKPWSIIALDEWYRHFLAEPAS